MRLSPIMPKPARQIVDDLSIVAHPRRWRHSAADALHSALAGGNRAFAFTPPGSGGKHYVRQFCGFGIEKVLHHQEFQSGKQFERAMPVSLRIGWILTQHIERG